MIRVLCGVCLALIVCAAVAIAADEEGFVPLFNGKDLTGWEGNKELWIVKDGMLVGKSPGIQQNEFLATEKSFGNFELRLEFRMIDGKGNSGIQYRSKRVPDSTEVSGYQADLGDSYWGALYDESRRNRVLQAPKAEELAKVLKKDGWNEYVIRAEGTHLTQFVNGLKTVDYEEKEADIADKGIMAVQIHSGGPMEIQFKNIRIKELK
jgi:hypothetical protein